MTGVRPVRLIHDKRAAGWSAEQIDRFFFAAVRLLGAKIRNGEGNC